MSPEMDQEEALDRDLETRLGRALRALPDRRAPLSLESRVLDAIARRAPLPWWRRSFGDWPAAARIAFGVTGALVAALTVLAAGAAHTNMDTLGAPHALSTPLHEASVVFVVTKTLSTSLSSVLSSGWVLGGLAAGAALYAALFGLGITAYRTLYLPADHEVQS